MLQKMRSKQGFTLIELLIVVAIIGILAAIAIPQFSQYRARGWMAATRSDVKNFYTAVTAWLNDDPTRTVTIAEKVVGAAQSVNYAGANVTTGVTINVDAAAPNVFTVIGTHAQLNGNYTQKADGTTADTLAAK